MSVNVEPETKPELNVEMILKVTHHIKEDLRRLEMDRWGRNIGKDGEYSLLKGFPPCGTKACFAGWTVLLSKTMEQLKVEGLLEDYGYEDGFLLNPYVEVTAGRILGLTQNEQHKLFFAGARGSLSPEDQYHEVVIALQDIFKERGVTAEIPE